MTAQEGMRLGFSVLERPSCLNGDIQKSFEIVQQSVPISILDIMQEEIDLLRNKIEN